MKTYFSAFRALFLLSFLGSFTPGVITMGVLQAALSGGLYAAIQFSLGAVAIEVLFIWIILRSSAWFYARPYLFRYMEWLSFFALIGLTVSCFLKLRSGVSSSESILPVYPPWFFSGLVFRLVTPTFVAFWLGWFLTMLSTSIATPNAVTRNISALAAGVGTFVAHSLFVLLYFQAAHYIRIVQEAGNWIIFLLLSGSSLWMIFRIFRKKPLAMG